MEEIKRQREWEMRNEKERNRVEAVKGMKGVWKRIQDGLSRKISRKGNSRKCLSTCSKKGRGR